MGMQLGLFTLRKEHRLRVFENRVQEAGGDYIMRSFITCTVHKTLLG
jgi:hypothetical protein